ncbi:MAG: GTPase Obg, partial [Desulfobacterales bacterium]
LPNSGKSTLIRAISSARPKTGSYPFTTLTPNLGVVQADQNNHFVVADIPGLIEGAHQGAGLGIRFLRHVERTRILVFLIDVSAIDPENVLKEYETLNHELSMYGKSLMNKPRIVVLNKLDLPCSDQKLSLFLRAAKGVISIGISAKTGMDVENLIASLLKMLEKSGG